VRHGLGGVRSCKKQGCESTSIFDNDQKSAAPADAAAGAGAIPAPAHRNNPFRPVLVSRNYSRFSLTMLNFP
jgi:hypothetical protein